MRTLTPQELFPSLCLSPLESATVFHAAAGQEILRINKDGMLYKGKLIEDAGEAHRAFLEAMRTIIDSSRNQAPITP